MGTHPIFESDFDCLTEMARKPRKQTDKEPQIQSDDEISDSEPMSKIDEFHQDIDNESESDGESEVGEYEVGAVDGRSDSEEEKESEEEDKENPFALPSRDAFGKNLKNFLHTDVTQKELRKKKNGRTKRNHGG